LPLLPQLYRSSPWSAVIPALVGRGYAERQVRRLVEWYIRVKQAG
jgi:predicted Ser/Thr protein kinase